MKSVRNIAWSIIVAMAVIGSSAAHAEQLASWFSSDQWLAFYYPSRSDLTIFNKSPPLASIEACRVWVDQERKARGTSGTSDDYECGVNCQPVNGSDMFMCDRTER